MHVLPTVSGSTRIIDTPGIKGFGLVEMDPATISDQFPRCSN
jgi:putative ribosome biogenesis GTPase RsgA